VWDYPFLGTILRNPWAQEVPHTEILLKEGPLLFLKVLPKENINEIVEWFPSSNLLSGGCINLYDPFSYSYTINKSDKDEKDQHIN
jgi:hypothetical protein